MRHGRMPPATDLPTFEVYRELIDRREAAESALTNALQRELPPARHALSLQGRDRIDAGEGERVEVASVEVCGVGHWGILNQITPTVALSNA